MEIQTCGRPIDSLLEKVLCMNILSSDYFKELYRLKTYHEVIDEIYNQVDHVEPWMTGNCRGPSTAFCLLYKFFTMKLTVKQMHGLLKHPDSPYIRAVCTRAWQWISDFTDFLFRGENILCSLWYACLCLKILLVCALIFCWPFLIKFRNLCLLWIVGYFLHHKRRCMHVRLFNCIGITCL